MNCITVKLASNLVSVSSIRIGQFAKLVLKYQDTMGDKIFDGNIVVRTTTGLVNLNRLETSLNTQYYDYDAEILPTGSTVELEIGTPPELYNLNNIPDVHLNAIRDLYAKGQTINAIKMVRELTLVGLKEAKEYVESLVY